MSLESYSATKPAQVAAIENAEELVQEDYADGVVDGEEWAGDLPMGEILRILAEAYTGELEIDQEALEERREG